MAGKGNFKMDEVGWDVFSGCEHWKFNSISTEGGLPGTMGSEHQRSRDGDACGRGVLLLREAEVQPLHAEVPQAHRSVARRSGRRAGHPMDRSAPCSLVELIWRGSVMWGMTCSKMNGLGDMVPCDLVDPRFDVLSIGRG
jgi:hypothetical protein